MKGVGQVHFGVGLVKIGPLFVPKMKGQNLQRKLKKKSGRDVWLEIGVKDALFNYFLRFFFSGCVQGGKSSKIAKDREETQIFRRKSPIFWRRMAAPGPHNNKSSNCNENQLRAPRSPAFLPQIQF